jgi:uncharacterized membrane protein YeaQ/YmgE (transglycosylase-associated protein family)
MDISIGDIIVWILVGSFAGSIVGAIVKGKKAGYGRYKNFVIGLAGAAIGGILFKVLRIDLGFADLAISFEDIISALIGSFLLLLLLWFVQKKRAAKDPGS